MKRKALLSLYMFSSAKPKGLLHKIRLRPLWIMLRIIGINVFISLRELITSILLDVSAVVSAFLLATSTVAQSRSRPPLDALERSACESPRCASSQPSTCAPACAPAVNTTLNVSETVRAASSRARFASLLTLTPAMNSSMAAPFKFK